MKAIKEYHKITGLLSRHPVRVFCVANFLTTVSMVMSLSFDDIPQWAPGLFAMLIVAFLNGKSGVYELIKSASFKHTNLKWYGAAFVFPILLCGLSYLIISFMEYKELVYLKFNRSWSDYAILVFFIVSGSYGEELGWRGFMLPQLLKKYSLLTSSLRIGIFWGIWHLNILSGVSVFITYLILVIEFSFISTWLYIKTKRNLLTTIILHTSINICSAVFFEKFVMAESVNKHTMLFIYGTSSICFLPLGIWAIRDMCIIQHHKPNQ